MKNVIKTGSVTFKIAEIIEVRAENVEITADVSQEELTRLLEGIESQGEKLGELLNNQIPISLS